MSRSPSSSKLVTATGWTLIVLGVAVFAIRLQHGGPYAVPRGANLAGGAGSLAAGAVLVWLSSVRALRWAALAIAPVVVFLGLHAAMAELEEVVSLYAVDRSGRAAELRLWIVDEDGAEWVGMPRSKAIEHSLDGARLKMLRGGKIRCVVPRLHDDRATASRIHALKVEKYAVARGAAALGLYPDEAGPNTVALRMDACPAD